MRPLLLAFCLVSLTATNVVAEKFSARATRAMVATVHPEATRSALTALQQGGNAVDAAIAAGLMLGVVDGHNSGIGGGCLILIHTADGQVVAIDGRETAPAAAHRDMYLRNGKADPTLSQTGALASGVPGALAAYQLATQRYGRIPMTAALERGAEVAQRGFLINSGYASRLRSSESDLAKFAGSQAVFFTSDGKLHQAGDRLQQPDLATTYRALARDGIDWFYRGPFAQQTERWMLQHGGIMTAADFAAYQAIVREPLRSRYRGYEILGFPPPSSGGVHIAQMLNLLESFDLPEIGADDPAKWVHIVGEAMKLAFADRAHWLGDPDFARVPRGLLDPDYARSLAQRIDPASVIDVPAAGDPWPFSAATFDRHTTHLAVADAEGNWVAMTQTVNTGFGSKVIVPGLGVIMNNEMDDFAIAPGVPNAFGLVGNEPNQVEPGKRPLSSMSPSIVLREGKPWFSVGAAGGPKIITQSLLTILRRIDLQMPLNEALAAPRFHHQWRPDTLVMTRDWDSAIVDALQRLGHPIERAETLAVVQAIERLEDGTFVGVHDPHVQGLAQGL